VQPPAGIDTYLVRLHAAQGQADSVGWLLTQTRVAGEPLSAATYVLSDATGFTRSFGSLDAVEQFLTYSSA
jgi:hypothetical protein